MILHIKTTDSTNSEAKRLIPSIQQDFAIFSDEQTAGRGRLNNRSWISVNGNLHCSIVINISSIPTNNRAILIDKTLLSIKRILEIFFKKQDAIAQIIIKSPNDILVNEKKIAGVLIEVDGDFAIIGIGLNISHSPIQSSTSIADIAKTTPSTKTMCQELFKEVLHEISS